MKDQATWSSACRSQTCLCSIPEGQPCEVYRDGDAKPGTVALCACCGWPEVSHVPEQARLAVRHPWHVEAALRAAIADTAVEVRRLQDNLRGEARFVIVAPPGRAVHLARKVPVHLDRYVSIELA